MESSSSLVGRRFGPYILEELLGRGGMGEVYRASHARLPNRRAAVKILPAALIHNPDFLRRFDQEANSVAALDHPNILPLWDYGDQDGLPYLAMPLVVGGSLRELLAARGTLPPERAEPFLRQIAAALDHAHGRGIIHRDVKPANILLRDDGSPLLADFGIAKALEETEGLTRTGVGVGTPEYMAPEQLEGRAEERSDLYALGVMLYEMLTGRVPFSGPTPYAVALRHIREPLPSPFLSNPGLPRGIGPVLDRALAKEPAARYASGADFVAAFRAALAAPGAQPTIVDPPESRPTIPALVAPAPPTVTMPPPPFVQPPGAARPWTRPLIWSGLAALVLLTVVAVAIAIATRGTTGTTTANLGVPSPSVAANRTATGAGTGGQPPSPTLPNPSSTAAATGTSARATATIAPTGAAGNWGPALAPLTGGQAYDDARDRFSLRVPSGWIELPPSGNIVVAYTGPITGATVPPTMNVYLEDISGLPDRTLDTFAQRSTQVSEAQLRADYPDFALISRDRVTVNGLPAYSQVFTATVSGIKLQLQQVYFLDPSAQVAHILTFGSLPANFAQQAATFNAIAGAYQTGP